MNKNTSNTAAHVVNTHRAACCAIFCVGSSRLAFLYCFFLKSQFKKKKIVKTAKIVQTANSTGFMGDVFYVSTASDSVSKRCKSFAMDIKRDFEHSSVPDDSFLLVGYRKERAGARKNATA